ncbi:hypothetical protein GCM10027168_57720 [Streptomyces capparidis]
MSAAPTPRQGPSPEDRLALACALRDDWLAHGLSTAPADRPRAEAAVTALYALLGAEPPEFVWVPSPAAAPAVLRELVPVPALRPARLRAASSPVRGADWPLAARLASHASDLRSRLDAGIGRPLPLFSWRAPGMFEARTLSPDDALGIGVPLPTVLEAAVRDPLTASLGDAVRAPLRTALSATDEPADSPGLTWYGQHDAHWVGWYDINARAGTARYGRDDARGLALWAELARSAGWWWPHERVCVMAERPTALHTEPQPGARHGEVRLHHPDRPAVRFGDGTEMHVLHGTHVPAWVIGDPTVERIHAETNIEVRRSAIERIGWDAYIEQAGLQLVAEAPDPGNPGADLRLYHLPRQVWGAPARVLLVVNGSAEPDGRHRRYGLSVPDTVNDPVAAAGWSYGLSGAQYARLARRT